jgi:hypothetical protein
MHSACLGSIFVNDEKIRENGRVPTTCRGWNLINLDALKNPPEGFAAFVYVASALVLLTLVSFGLLSSFRFAYETLIGNLENRVEAAKSFFPL